MEDRVDVGEPVLTTDAVTETVPVGDALCDVEIVPETVAETVTDAVGVLLPDRVTKGEEDVVELAVIEIVGTGVRDTDGDAVGVRDEDTDCVGVRVDVMDCVDVRVLEGERVPDTDPVELGDIVDERD